MIRRNVAVGVAGEHARQLLDALLLRQQADLGDRPAIGVVLLHPEVRVSMGCELGEVRHTQHLPAAGQTRELASHRVGRGTADARVDLVEDQHLRLVGISQCETDSQGDAAAFAA